MIEQVEGNFVVVSHWFTCEGDTRFLVFHCPLWVECGDLSDWFGGKLIVDFDALVQLPLFLIA